MSNQGSAREIMYQGAAFAVAEDIVKLETGKAVKRQVVIHPGAVVILALDREGGVLLVEQHRHAIGKRLLELPAGTLEPGETPLECAKREIQEEVGVGAKNWTPLGEIYPAPGISNEVQYCYLATDLYPSELEADEDEDLTVTKLSFAELGQAISSEQLTDAKSLALLCRAKLMGVLRPWVAADF